MYETLWERIWWSVVMTKCLGQMDFKKMDLAFFSTPPLAPSAQSFEELHHSANLVQMAALEHEPDEVGRASHSKESVDSAACAFQGGQHRQFRSFFHAAALSENSNLSASLSQNSEVEPNVHETTWGSLECVIGHIHTPRFWMLRIHFHEYGSCYRVLPHSKCNTQSMRPTSTPVHFNKSSKIHWGQWLQGKKLQATKPLCSPSSFRDFLRLTIFTRVPRGEGQMGVSKGLVPSAHKRSHMIYHHCLGRPND